MILVKRKNAKDVLVLFIREIFPTLFIAHLFTHSLNTIVARLNVGRIRTVVSTSHCGCENPGSIPGFCNTMLFILLFLPAINISRSQALLNL